MIRNWMTPRWLALAGLLILQPILAAQQVDLLSWDLLPNLPPHSSEQAQPGVAGAYIGQHAGALIVAGGTNFPEGPPWDGGAKAWRDEIYVLLQGEDGPYWHPGVFTLPKPMASGVAVTTADGVVVVGGSDGQSNLVDVYRLRWLAAEQTIDIETLPALPRTLAEMGGALIGETIYLVGGRETVAGPSTDSFLALDLSVDSAAWRDLPAWPGPARALPVVAAQSDGEFDSLFVFSGRRVTPGEPSVPLSDAYRYDPITASWARIANVATTGNSARCVMGAPAIGWGANHILVFGGDDGASFLQRELLAQQLAETEDPDEVGELQRLLRQSFIDHPGFPRDVLAYHTVTDTWSTLGQFEAEFSHAVTTAVRWQDSIVIPSGETRPGERTPDVLRLTLSAQTRFGTANYWVLGLYLIGLASMGVYFARREQSADDYFRAGGRIPWWAAGISIFGTQLSAITFMAVPAKTFATDWRFLALNISIVIVAPLIAYVFLPFFRRLNVTTAYEYLEMRFSLAVRLVASAQFVVYQLGRIGIVLFLPSLALSVVTGIDVTVCILVMGILCIFYTALGGIEAVIWTDVIQVILLLGGAVLCIVLIAVDLPASWREAVAVAEDADKFKTFDFRLDYTTATFWVLLFGGIGQSLVGYGTDQAVVQRYLTTKNEAMARRGIWFNAALTMPATLLFFALGTALYVFFQSHPEALSPAISQPDAIFPWFIVTQLPAGVAGLLIGGLFAAAMSSLDSSMNSVATAVTTDFYRRFNPDAADRTCLNIARWATVVVGALGTALALLMAELHIQSLWDQMGAIVGLFGGGLAGLFLLGMFTRGTSAAAALVALMSSTGIQFWLREATTVHAWVLPISGVVTCFVLGLALSAVLPNQKGTDGLTVHTLNSRPQ